MLTFLYLAAKQGFVVNSYDDDAVGVMTKNQRGKLYVSRVTLRPRIVFSGEKRPSEADIGALHHHAHEECYIANSVLTEVVVEPPVATAVSSVPAPLARPPQICQRHPATEPNARGMNIVEPILFQAKINPNSIAICTPGTRMDFVTYAGLARIIDSLGHVALSLGLKRGDIVAIYVSETIFHAALVLALTRSAS